jgi:hypothetical protein
MNIFEDVTEEIKGHIHSPCKSVLHWHPMKTKYFCHTLYYEKKKMHRQCTIILHCQPI